MATKKVVQKTSQALPMVSQAQALERARQGLNPMTGLPMPVITHKQFLQIIASQQAKAKK